MQDPKQNILPWEKNPGNYCDYKSLQKSLKKSKKIRDITTTRPPISFICLPEPWQDSDVYR